jgi:Putative DNA-binding domain
MMLEQDFKAALMGHATPHVRFPIYRNNVSQGLIGGLRVRFPIVEQLVGAEFFSAMAGEYVATHKPSSAVLIYYGASFSEFLASFEAASSLPYLPDVARFENAWWLAYHASEAAPLSGAVLTEIAPEDLGAIKFKFHPSVQLYQAAQGAVSIWQWHQIHDNTEVLDVRGQEFALISRPHAEVDVRLIGADSFAFFAHLKSGADLETALTETQMRHPDFDLQSSLVALFQLELITGLSS